MTRIKQYNIQSIKPNDLEIMCGKYVTDRQTDEIPPKSPKCMRFNVQNHLKFYIDIFSPSRYFFTT